MINGKSLLKFLYTTKKNHIGGEPYYICEFFFFKVKVVKHVEGGYRYQSVTPNNNLIVPNDQHFKTLKDAKMSLIIDGEDLINYASRKIQEVLDE